MISSVRAQQETFFLAIVTKVLQDFRHRVVSDCRL